MGPPTALLLREGVCRLPRGSPRLGVPSPTVTPGASAFPFKKTEPLAADSAAAAADRRAHARGGPRAGANREPGGGRRARYCARGRRRREGAGGGAGRPGVGRGPRSPRRSGVKVGRGGREDRARAATAEGACGGSRGRGAERRALRRRGALGGRGPRAPGQRPLPACPPPGPAPDSVSPGSRWVFPGWSSIPPISPTLCGGK